MGKMYVCEREAICRPSYAYGACVCRPALVVYAGGEDGVSVWLACRYGLDELGQEAADAGDGGPGGRASGGGSGSGEASRPRRLSKHERAALKKGLTLEEFRAQQEEEETRRLSAAPAAEDPAADAAAAAAAAAAALQAERGSAAPPPAAKRGQKGKLKKRQGKYADQDAEDAAILAAALGAQGQAKSRGERRAERKAKKDAKKQAGIDVRLCSSHLQAWNSQSRHRDVLHTFLCVRALAPPHRGAALLRPPHISTWSTLAT